MDDRLSRIAEQLIQLKLWSAFDPMAVNPQILPNFYVLEVQRRNEDVRLLIRLAGTALDTFFKRPITAHYLEEFIHGPRGQDVIAGFHACAADHRPLWMRQVVQFPNRAPLFVEGVVVYLDPARICGGLLAGEVASGASSEAFERKYL